MSSYQRAEVGFESELPNLSTVRLNALDLLDPVFLRRSVGQVVERTVRRAAGANPSTEGAVRID